jgi:hypothetical protein
MVREVEKNNLRVEIKYYSPVAIICVHGCLANFESVGHCATDVTMRGSPILEACV